MKTLYIPKGKNLHYEALACQNIVNDGVLTVEKAIQARDISGHGILNAGSISCRSLAAMDIEAAAITTERLAAERVCASEVRASRTALASCYLEAAYVETPRLTVAMSQIGELRAHEVVNLPDKGQSIWTALVSGFFRRLWLNLTNRIPVDAGFEPVPEESEPEPEPCGETPHTPEEEPEDDFEFKRLTAMYRLMKESGYLLRITPLPEETAGCPTVLQDAA